MHPKNVFNFDETDQTNDPGKKDYFVRRGQKRVENVQDHSKTGKLN